MKHQIIAVLLVLAGLYSLLVSITTLLAESNHMGSRLVIRLDLNGADCAHAEQEQAEQLTQDIRAEAENLRLVHRLAGATLARPGFPLVRREPSLGIADRSAAGG